MAHCRCGHDSRAHHASGRYWDGEFLYGHCLYTRCRCPLYLEVCGVDVEVPERYATVALEYRSGYEKGVKEDGAYNPISKRGPEGLKRRRAWEAGRQAGRKVRLRNGGGGKIDNVVRTANAG
jgi:hypothetical protein